GRAAEPARPPGDQGRRTLSSRAGRGDYLRVARRREHHGRHAAAHGNVELSYARRAAGAPRSRRCLARASIAPGEHQQDQGDRPLVQSELHPADEGREGDGDSGQPHADAATPRVSEALVASPAPSPTGFGEPGSSGDAVAVPVVPVAQERPIRVTVPSIRLAQLKEELVAWL